MDRHVQIGTARLEDFRKGAQTGGGQPSVGSGPHADFVHRVGKIVTCEMKKRLNFLQAKLNCILHVQVRHLTHVKRVRETQLVNSDVFQPISLKVWGVNQPMAKPNYTIIAKTPKFLATSAKNGCFT